MQLYDFYAQFTLNFYASSFRKKSKLIIIKNKKPRTLYKNYDFSSKSLDGKEKNKQIRTTSKSKRSEQKPTR